MIPRAVRRHQRELSALLVLAFVLALAGALAPSFFGATNLRDLAVNDAPILIVAIGATLVILVGQIDISVGSQFAVCAVAAGGLARRGVPVPLLLPCTVAIGAAMGALNGLLIGPLGLPSIIVTLAMLVAWRDGLRWVTQGAWVQDLPADFQWFGLGQSAGQWAIVGAALALLVACAWMLRHLGAGRAVYAVGSDADIVIFDPNREQTISAKTHHMRVDYSAYEGRKVRGVVETVFSRGTLIVENGAFKGKAGDGQFLRRGSL